MKKPSGREKTKLTSPEVRAAATLKRLSPPRSTRKQEEALLEEFYPGGGGTPYDGLYGEAPPERAIFFRLQVYERVGISLVEEYKRVGKSVIKGLMTDEFYGFITLRKRSIFVIDSHLKDSALTAVKRDAKF